MNVLFDTTWENRKNYFVEIYQVEKLTCPPYVYYAFNSDSVELIKFMNGSINIMNYETGPHAINKQKLITKFELEEGKRFLEKYNLNGSMYLIDCDSLEVIINYQEEKSDPKFWQYFPPNPKKEVQYQVFMDNARMCFTTMVSNGIHVALFIKRFASNSLLKTDRAQNKDVPIDFITEWFGLPEVKPHVKKDILLEGKTEFNIPEECLVELKKLGKPVAEGVITLTDLRDKIVDYKSIRSVVNVSMDYPISGIKKVCISRGKIQFYRDRDLADYDHKEMDKFNFKDREIIWIG